MINQARNLMDALEVSDNEDNLELALEVINKYGSYKKALQATIGIEFKKKEALLIALLGSQETNSQDVHSAEAKRLIDLAREINDKVFKDSQRLSIQFNELIDKIKLDAMIKDNDLAILNTVKPHRNAKLLIININAYQDGNIQLQAFIEALENSSDDALQISNDVTKRLRIKK
ncbi:MAG: hypothetical protein GQ570_11650 [Helicobacteraceae bacterium]|nr:hypothetical protein [Helicobacteraceae bacterium]